MNDDPQFCPSMAYQIRESDSALIARQCQRPHGHNDRAPHRNGIASDAGAWTTDEAMESLLYVLGLLPLETDAADARERAAAHLDATVDALLAAASRRHLPD